MLQPFEAVIDGQGNVRLLEPVHLSGARRALVVIFDEPQVKIPESALLSEATLAQDWNRPEENEAWSYLQQRQSS